MVEEYLYHMESAQQLVNEDNTPRYNGDVTASDLNNWALSSKTCVLVNSNVSD